MSTNKEHTNRDMNNACRTLYEQLGHLVFNEDLNTSSWRQKMLCALQLCLTFNVCTAGTMYRCGNSFSQQPCGPDAKEIVVKGVAPAGPQVRSLTDTATDSTKLKSQQICQDAIVTRLKDPDSAKFSGVVRGGAFERPVPAIGGPLTKIVSYNGYVNAKNAMGGYTGNRLWFCTLDISEKSIIETSILE